MVDTSVDVHGLCCDAGTGGLRRRRTGVVVIHVGVAVGGNTGGGEGVGYKEFASAVRPDEVDVVFLKDFACALS